jgi:hypothetical protein
LLQTSFFFFEFYRHHFCHIFLVGPTNQPTCCSAHSPITTAAWPITLAHNPIPTIAPRIQQPRAQYGHEIKVSLAHFPTIFSEKHLYHKLKKTRWGHLWSWPWSPSSLLPSSSRQMAYVVPAGGTHGSTRMSFIGHLHRGPRRTAGLIRKITTQGSVLHQWPHGPWLQLLISNECIHGRANHLRLTPRACRSSGSGVASTPPACAQKARR